MPTRTVVFGLGSNLGGRASLLRAGAELLAARLGARGLRAAPVWRTEPVGPPQPEYLNSGVAVETALELPAILDVALGVEADLGRERRARWGPRSLDLDILWHAGAPLRTSRLSVPHAELAHRPFALAPLLALVPDARGADGERLAALPAAERSPGALVSPSLAEGFSSTVLSHTADEGFEVRALDRADLLAAAVEALGAIIVDPASVAPAELRAIRLEVAPDDDDDARVIALLSEALYALDADRFALRRAAVLEDGATLRAVLVGEPLDEARHAVRTAVKAVTWHGLEVGEDAGERFARVIVDL
ncbi:MAG: 2-amino-4-hydroxy-6-hydroxymethyldihydropteridine diphosphokinase [Polyangiales bacterium]